MAGTFYFGPKVSDEFYHSNLIRSEIFSAERLEQHAESLAAAQSKIHFPKHGKLLEERLARNSRILRDIYHAMGKAIEAASELPPAAEWLVDNYFIIEEQIRDIHNDLPPQYYQQLPKLATGHLAGYPRVYAIAWAFIAHTDSFFNPVLLKRFIQAYQRQQPLNIGELWAISITLRIALIENLCRAAMLIIEDRRARAQADKLADQLLNAIDSGEYVIEQQIKKLDRAVFSSAFSVQLIQRLREQDPRVLPLLHHLDARLHRQGTSAEEIVRTEHQNQGALTVTVRNIITSMRSLSVFDWVDFFESVSLVDEKLRKHSLFGDMDLPTRNLYRRAIERLAQRSPLSEMDVTDRVLQIAGCYDDVATNPFSLPREKDPGYYLIDKGAPVFEKEIHFKPKLHHKIRRIDPAVNFLAYIGANIAIVIFIIKEGLSGAVSPHHSLWILLALASAALLPAWEAAITLTNRVITGLFAPTILPGMALREGVPPSLRTMIVVPTLLTSVADIEAQIESLEVHYLSNSDGDLYFALLSDWKDSDREILPQDVAQIEAANAAIDRLNNRYEAGAGGPRFFLFHRRRLWNAQQGKWMGWERKRGKLHEFNRLLRGAQDTSFLLSTDPTIPKLPDNVRFVITLDADTRLPRGTVKRLIGKMAHPLNQARFDPVSRTVSEGYGILQPRVASSLPQDLTNSPFQRIFYSASGIDPYAFAISDVYQDLFNEGSFTGKGIYDVDAFEQSIATRIPENTVLSHDLLEGIFARAGLASDVEMVEEFPSRYDVASTRQHRWARGDWQLLPWIFGGFSAEIVPLGHWKMVDNLRRSLTAPMVLLALLMGWSFPIGAAILWTLLIICCLAMPLLVALAESLIPRRGTSLSSHALTAVKDIVRTSQQIVLMIIFLPHQAWLMIDAIARTLWRLTVSRHNLLEWVTAAEAKVSRERDIAGFYTYMSGSLVLVVLIAVCLSAAQTTMWDIALPFLAVWMLAPAIAQIVSRSTPSFRQRPLEENEKNNFRHIARATWRFFDRFVTAQENYLPPDNFQEDPLPVIAHRTSPTNIGLYLLSVITAHDFGWLGIRDVLRRLSETSASLEKMERFRGHYYNWYDTQDLRALLPRYISSVDSGNLAGYLLIIASVCRTFDQEKIINPHWAQGLSDSVALIRHALQKKLPSDDGASLRNLRQNLSDIETLIEKAETSPHSLGLIYTALGAIDALASAFQDLAFTAHAEKGNKATSDDADLRQWGRELRDAVQIHINNLKHYAPWLGLSAGGLNLVEQIPPPLAAILTGRVPRLDEVEELCAHIETLIKDEKAPWHRNLAQSLNEGKQAAAKDRAALQALARQIMQLFQEMDFTFLFDNVRQLLSIGYRVEDSMLDSSFYDLLASEARLASIVAIAKGDIPARNWFRLGRTVTSVNYRSMLVSWSGSMFEYLMPFLVMREPPESLLGQTNRMAVRRQIEYGKERGVPWGISESAYNARDIELTYQYLSFGVPGLGLKRGLSDNVVIAPYATALAAMIDPAEALRNFDRLENIGGRGYYGWYEAVDFTNKRLPEGANHAVVHAYMAHHQGMSLIALGNILHNGLMRERFHAEPLIQATELLLQELPPRNVALAKPRAEEVEAVANIREIVPPNPRCFTTPHSPMPRTHLLSNGDYAVMVTAAGSGYSLWRNLAVTRWREDATRDQWGSYIYIRDAQNGKIWSAAYQPVCADADTYNVAFFEDHAEFTRRDGGLTTVMNVVVASEDQGEARRISLTNQGDEPRDIELTSYAEIVLSPQSADIAHPAFNKLFVQTEFIPGSNALLATRRMRHAEDAPVWAVHVVSIGGSPIGNLQYETDRARFLGRGHTLRNPQAMDGRPLNDTAGTVLDAVFSLRCRVRIAPGATVHVAFWTLTASSREEALNLADKYRTASAYNRVTSMAWTQAQLQYQHLGMGTEEAHLFQRLANYALYADRALRPNNEALKRGSAAQSVLWSAGISGDKPIIVLRVDVASDLKTLRQMVSAHSYWAIKRLEVDLVILNEQPTSYLEDLQNEIELLVRTSQALPRSHSEGPKGKIFVLRSDQVSAAAKSLLLACARAVLVGHRGSLAEQMAFQIKEDGLYYSHRRSLPAPKSPISSRPRPALEFFNGIGGFADRGREYVILLEPGHYTPAPWINVIANPHFGFQVSAEGAGYSWAESSREYKLTPWSNDPVSDEAGEIIYLSDLDSGALWTPTATPIRKEGVAYEARHGFGYSQFETSCYHIESKLMQFVPLHDAVKISHLTLHNKTGFTRRLSVTSYTEWVLGPARHLAAAQLASEMDTENSAMLVRNPWSNDFNERVSFVAMTGNKKTYTADKREFLGRNGALHNPIALTNRAPLSGKTGIGLDPCAVLQSVVELKAGQKIEIIILLGSGENKEQAQNLIKKYQAEDINKILAGVKNYWNGVLGRIQIETPDRATDIMQNGWLLYQTIVCRIWARSGFYQSSGAYGYRDQLQDVMTLVFHNPAATRAHILRAAGRQFPEGDVQHWWLPSKTDLGRGVRTRFSDDPLWLAYVTAYYIHITGDAGILDESVGFLQGPLLKEDEAESFFLPQASEQKATLFDHCVLAINCRLTTGGHGLGLFGGGDWNDGMNRVGIKGKGESVWLSWFLLKVIKDFSLLAQARAGGHVAQWQAHAGKLKQALEEQAWDGEWYRRGYYDDGMVLGSASNDECRIDSIAQSWAVLSDAGDQEHRLRAMKAVEQNLIKQDEGLALLFAPPFDHTHADPGYIKGYPPGIRENGGQYTHAALWSVMAFGQMGNGDKAFSLFSMLNPINHSNSRAGSYRYKVEPYVVAADIYANPQHIGRGGWTWYTGSSGWMYRVGLESILGFCLKGNRLSINPSMPHYWPEFKIAYRYQSTLYVITVDNRKGVGSGVVSVSLDGNDTGTKEVMLQDDGIDHAVRVIMG